MIPAQAALLDRVSLGLLDGYTTDLWSVGGLTKRLSAYSGPCIRVRRSSDDAEQDIGFTGWYVDADALLAFAGGGDAHVKTVYDQSGNGRTWTQGTNGKQPRVVSTGVFDACIRFDAADDHIATSASTGGVNTGLTLHMQAGLRSSSGAQTVFEQGANYNHQRSPMLAVEAGTLRLLAHNGTGGIYNVSIFGAMFPTRASPVAYRWDTTQAAASKCTVFSGGAAFARTSNADLSGGNVSGAFSGEVCRFGARPDLSSYSCALDLVSFAVYTAAQSNTTVLRILSA